MNRIAKARRFKIRSNRWRGTQHGLQEHPFCYNTEAAMAETKGPDRMSCEEGHSWRSRIQGTARHLSLQSSSLAQAVRADSGVIRSVHCLKRPGASPAHFRGPNSCFATSNGM